MSQPPTPADLRYLKGLWYLAVEGGMVAVGGVAERMGVSHASASTAVTRLVDNGFVVRGERGLELTTSGRSTALRLVRRHRLLETFFARVLGLGWDEVHDQAEAVEWSLTDRLEERIAAVLEDPDRDPHGDPIPPVSGTHQEIRDEPLAQAPPGATATIARVSDDDPDLLRFLTSKGLGIGTVIQVEDQEPFGGPLWVSSPTGRHALGTEVVRAISVEARRDSRAATTRGCD